MLTTTRSSHSSNFSLLQHRHQQLNIMSAANDLRCSHLVLLRSIARRIGPEMLKEKEDVYLQGEDLRPIDKEFASWPERYPTLSTVWYDLFDETITFHWGADCDEFGHQDVVFDVASLEDDDVSVQAQDPSDMELLEQVDALNRAPFIPFCGSAAVPHKKRRLEEVVDAKSALTTLKPPSIVLVEGMDHDDVITAIARHLARWVDDNDAELRKSKDLCYQFTREQMEIIDDIFLRSGPIRWSPPSTIEWHCMPEDDRDDNEKGLTHGDLQFFWNSPACGGRKCVTSADVSVWAELGEDGVTELNLDIHVGYW